MTPVVAIVGRPNVGKSTLFNRLVGRRIALVDDTPGVTRDRREGKAKLGDLTFTVVDTAGLEEADIDSLEGRMRAQTEAAVESSDIVLFVVDCRAGMTPLDEHFADILRRTSRPVILVANKAEGREGQAGLLEAFSLGLGEPVPISAEHGEGMADLYSALVGHFPDPDAEDDPPSDVVTDTDEADEEGLLARPLKLTVVGRPNAGKSTLINRMLGEDRLLTGPEAGITRDAITVPWEWRGRRVDIVDTAGLRRKARVEGKLEKLSVGETLRSIRFAEVVLVTLDATASFEKQDLQIADLVIREGRAIVVALDKWDLVEDRGAAMKAAREQVDRLLPQIRGVELVPVSGLTGVGIDKVLDAAFRAREIWSKRISTGRLNRWLSGVLEHHPPPAVSGRRIKLRYMTQAKSRPPHFIVFCSRPEALPESYTRYLVNGIRETFEITGCPIRLTLRKGDNPFAED
ncbi:ribosome biogenesis GTPase Der [Segnochrobactrum spirostomi]|uniref:GTPase Der n=1 Tax=Segnochrobactrum spirostomi TaxID=2608987 RepID=A0A6A7XY64_9HYPH|nr:ribosome biogenesis GTPase Der [Segnochrobactrum spirostomi]MQT11288.1 ribosome biogenesis GTPase Der [Segnochrobactrum spirostomi]